MPGKKVMGVFIFMAAVICAILALRGFVTENEAGKVYEELQTEAAPESEASEAEEVEEAEAEPTPTEPAPKPETDSAASEIQEAAAETKAAPEPDMVPCPIDFEAVTAACPDCYAWIRIQDTNIDYPILQSPTDNAYYLSHDAYGNSAYYGAIYTEDFNKKDFSDPLTVIYGHNMRNGSMFQNLHYFEDMAFLESHPTFEIYLPDKILTYQVFAAYNYDDRHLLATSDYTDKDAFRLYLKGILSQRSMSANIDQSVEVTCEDKVVTLSTCNGIYDQRYLVQGVLLSEMKTIQGGSSDE